MSFMNGMVTLGTRAVLGELGRYRYLGTFRERDKKDREALLDMQLARLKDVLVHAQQRVPYWNRLFNELGFEPHEVSTLEDLAALPVLTKDMIRQAGTDLLAKGYETRDLVQRQTGGSTGEPLVFWIDRDSLERQMSIHLRGFRRVGIDSSTRLAKIWGYGRENRLANNLAWVSGRLYIDAYRMDERALGSWYKALRNNRIEAIYGYTAAVHQFARYLLDEGKNLPTLKRVCVTAEKLYPEMRETMVDAFRAPITDMYGCHETVRLATECICGGMHIELDAAVLEFEQQGEDLPPRILLTTLLNDAMPFIRYDLGDYGHPVEGVCRCGNQSPLLSVDLGKVQHVYELPGGGRVHTTVFTKPLYSLPSVRSYQVRCSKKGHVEFLVVPRDSSRHEVRAETEKVASACIERLGHAVSISVRVVDEIPTTRRGKRPLVRFV